MYKLPDWDKINKMLLDKVYINTKIKIKSIFKENFLFNIISNKSNNIKNKQILNIIIFTKNHYIFSLFLKYKKYKYLNIAKNDS